MAKPSHLAGQPQLPFCQSRRQFYQGRPAYGRFINNCRFIKVEDQASGRNGRYITQKRANGRFHILPHKQFINGQVNLLEKSWQSEWPLYQTGQPHSSFASSAAP